MHGNKLQIINVNGADVHIRISDELNYITDTELIEKVMKWIEKYIRPYEQSDINYSHSSYLLKHIVESDLGIYVNNGVFKVAMAKLRFGISHRNSYLNPSYNIDERFFREFPDPRIKKKFKRPRKLRKRR